MWMQHVDTRPFGCLARYPVALALAAALSAGQLATPVLAPQKRPGAQQSADAPRNPAAGGQAGAPVAPARERKSPPPPPPTTPAHQVQLPAPTTSRHTTAR